MKIGILSLVLHTNYGGILQAFALQTVLERMGHEVIVLDKDRTFHKTVFRQGLSFTKNLLLRYILRRNVVYYTPQDINREREKREQHTKAFVEKYIHRSVVKRIEPGVFNSVDAIVVGSDQVWRPKYFKSQWLAGMEQAFLQFAGSSPIKRVAYAPSFGSDVWEYSEEETESCKHLLHDFNAVSVREESAITLCRDKLCRNDVKLVLDPTLLLSKEDYTHLVEKAGIEKSAGNLLCYILDDSEDKQALVNRIAKERHLTPFHINMQSKTSSNERVQPPVEQWIRGFMDADFVVTDSFHACIFSIIFEKPFVVVGNVERGMARFKSLLSMFFLENNLVCKVGDYDSSLTYDVSAQTKMVLEKKRNESLLFLTQSLV